MDNMDTMETQGDRDRRRNAELLKAKADLAQIEVAPAAHIRTEVLAEAMRLVAGKRDLEYGEPYDNFSNIAAGWRVILGASVEPHQVALAMAWVKACRVKNNPASWDNWVDLAGYAALGGELAEREIP